MTAARFGAIVAFALLLVWPYIDLGVALPIGSWAFDAPLADLFALAMCPFALLWLKERRLPSGALGYAVLLAAGCAGALGSAHAGEAPAAFHEFARKPLFFGVAYGLGFTAFIAHWRGENTVRTGLLVAVAVCAGLSWITSIGRIAAGNALWFQSLAGLTPNHKTLAVALAPALPLLWAWIPPPGTWGVTRRRVVGVVAFAALALALSVSRTAWISGAVGASFFVGWGGRMLAERRGWVPVLILLGVLAATYGPVLTGSITQLDALRSRHSLDKRSWHLFEASPLFGAGPGAGVRIEVPTFPDYRVNGVDAHGVVQKVGSEYGLVGLAGYGAFVVAMARRLRARHVRGDGRWPSFVALHTNLLLSTETFSQTHWALLAVILGLSLRDEHPDRAVPP